MEERNENLRQRLAAKDAQIVQLTELLLEAHGRNRGNPEVMERRIAELTQELQACRKEVARLRKLLDQRPNEQRRTDERTGSGTVRRLSVHDRVQKAYDRLRRFRLFR